VKMRRAGLWVGSTRCTHTRTHTHTHTHTHAHIHTHTCIYTDKHLLLVEAEERFPGDEVNVQDKKPKHRLIISAASVGFTLRYLKIISTAR
jgi:hypothetical protein